MKIDVFLACLLSHILFDFVFQVRKLLHLRFPVNKNSGQTLISKHNIIKIFKGNIFHATMHFIGTSVFLLIIINIYNKNIEYIFLLVFIIFVSHFIIDFSKSFFYLLRPRSESSLIVFFLDQILHVSIIFIVCYGSHLRRGFSSLITLFNQYPKSITILQKQLIALIVFFVATWCTGIFIKLFIKKLDSSQIHICNSNIKKAQSGVIINESGNVIKTISQEAKNGGFIIGILERIFIIVSILMNYSVVIGFVLTAKSFARLSKLSDESFAEYFIIGNLMSFISAILGGILLKSMFGL